MAVIDMSGYVADLKDHAAEHGFHIHDERHFLETYSLRPVSYTHLTLPTKA